MTLYLCSSLKAISVITWCVAIIGTMFRPLPVDTNQSEVNSRDVNADSLLELSTALLETSPKKLDLGAWRLGGGLDIWKGFY